MNEPDLPSQIAADLEKSGFAAEMRVLRTLHSRGWRATAGNSFYDLDENVSREFDVHGWVVSHHPVIEYRSVRVFSHLAIEVKRSSKPWVIFEHDALPQWQLDGGWNDVLSRIHDFPVEPSALLDIFVQHSLTRKLGWKGYGIHEAFKNPDQPSRWYPAFISAAKAAEHVLETSADPETSRDRLSRDPSLFPPELHIVQPVVILEGKLFRARLNEDGSPTVRPADAAEIDFAFKSPGYRRSLYRVLVVTVGGFAEQLQRLEARHQILFHQLMRLCGFP